MKKVLSFVLAMLLTFGMMTVVAMADGTSCEHDFLAMRNMVSHYEECQKCYEIRNAGNHEFKNGKCTVCGYDKFANPFIDVSESAWYYSDVIRAFYDGLINGKTDITFAPDLNITYVEAIKLAACMHQKYTEGVVTLTVGNPWYKPYLDYCIDNGIIKEEHGYDLNAPATRQGYMRIFAYSLPAEALEEINYVAEDAIPDVKKDPAIYKLYRAGIVGGVDAARNCNPNAFIKRSEVAAVLTRMMYKSARIEFTLGEKPSETEPLKFKGATSYLEFGNYIFFASVSGGETPYTYTWYYSDGEKVTKLANDSFVTFTDDGAGGATATFLFTENNPYLGKEVKLVITDANGESIDTGYTDIPKYFATEGPAEEQEENYGKLTITKQPEYVASAEEGMLIQYDVEVQGGKAPYTFEWCYYTGYKNLIETIVNGEYAHADGNVLKLGFYLDSPFLARRFFCKITDANGESVTTNTIKMPDAPFTMEIEDVINNSLGTIVVGRVKTGKIVPGEYIAFTFDGKSVYGAGKVEAIEMFNKQLDEATVNDRVGLLIKECETFLSRNAVLERDKQGLIGDTKNFAVKEALSVKVGDTPRGNIGDWTTMTVYADGGKAPYTYEWQFAFSLVSFSAFDNENWAKDINTDTLKFKVKEDEFAHAYAYRCVVTDAVGNVAYSEAKTVTPLTSVIGEHPTSVYANYGDEVQFNVKAYGAKGSALTYKWQYIYDGAKSFKDILPTDSWASGCNTDTLTIQVEKTELTSHVYYRCVVTDGEDNKVITAAATIFPDKPFISKQPGVVEANPDTYIKFSVAADGRYKPLTYKWYFYIDGMDGFLAVSKDHEWADGETTDTLTVGVDRKHFDGSFKCYCLITDAKGNTVKSLEGTVILSDDAGVDLETGHAPKDYPIVLIW